jgi:hypothetical protein
MTWKNYLPISAVGAFFLLLAARQQDLLPLWGCSHPFRPGEVSLTALCENLEACEDHASKWDESMLYLFVPDVEWVPYAVAEFENHFEHVQTQFVDWNPKAEPGPQFHLHPNGVSLWMRHWDAIFVSGLVRHPTESLEPVHNFGEILDGDALNHLFSNMNCWTTE